MHGERIDDQSVRGGFSLDGRLFATALVKGHYSQTVAPAGGETSSAEDERDGAGPVDVDEILLSDSRGVHLIPCNVLDLDRRP